MIFWFLKTKKGKRDVTQNRAKVKSAYHQSKNLSQEKNCNFYWKNNCHMSHYLYSITFFTSWIIKNWLIIALFLAKVKISIKNEPLAKIFSHPRIVWAEIFTQMGFGMKLWPPISCLNCNTQTYFDSLSILISLLF